MRREPGAKAAGRLQNLEGKGTGVLWGLRKEQLRRLPPASETGFGLWPPEP